MCTNTANSKWKIWNGKKAKRKQQHKTNNEAEKTATRSCRATKALSLFVFRFVSIVNHFCLQWIRVFVFVGRASANKCMNEYAPVYTCMHGRFELMASAAVVFDCVCIAYTGMDLNLRYAFMHCMFSDYHNLDNQTNKNMNGTVCLLWAYIFSMWSSTIPLYFSFSFAPYTCERIERAVWVPVCACVRVVMCLYGAWVFHDISYTVLHGKCSVGWLVGTLPSVVSGLIYFLRIFLSSGLNLHRYFIFVYGQARFNLGLSHSFSVIKFISPTIFFKSTISSCGLRRLRGYLPAFSFCVSLFRSHFLCCQSFTCFPFIVVIYIVMSSYYCIFGSDGKH